MYLRFAYFGWNMNGYATACRRLAIPTNSPISIRDAAALVSRLKYPEPKVASAPRNYLIRRRSEYLLHTISGNGSKTLVTIAAREILGAD
jgi:hypothetical protein